QLFRNMGGTIGIAVMGTIMQTSLTNQLEEAAKNSGARLAQLDPQTAQQLAPFQNPELLLDQPKLEQLQETLPATIQPLVTQMVETLRDALATSLTTVFLAGAALLAVAVILTFFLREIPLRTTNKMPEEETA